MISFSPKVVVPIFLMSALTASAALSPVTIHNDDPLIHFHGRWDSSPGTWWTGSGFKLHVQDLSTLSLVLGERTTSPYAAIGVSLDYAPFATFNASAGTNVIPLGKTGKKSVVRINVQGWQNNRIHLEKILLNKGAKLLPYKASPINLQFIGDSLTSGQFLPRGEDDAWPFLTAEAFKAEYQINAAPGAALTDMVSYGNPHGVSHQFFKTEDMGYIWASDHNYTTNWDFTKEKPQPTHVVIAIGANDASWSVPADGFAATLTSFVDRLRSVYPTQPFFIFTPWGWPSATGPNYYYYEGQYQAVIDRRAAVGDTNLHLVNTTGWVSYADVFPDNIHPDVKGHAKVSAQFQEWLKNWGLQPQNEWATPVAKA